jgi:hypothetical protein
MPEPQRCPSRSGGVLDDASVDGAGEAIATISDVRALKGMGASTGMARCGPRSLLLCKRDYDYSRR